jgi:hypothetical protein
MSITKTSKNGYLVLSELLTVPDSAGANVVTVNGSVISEDISNKNLVVDCTIGDVTAGDGAYQIKLQSSLDGVNFTTVDAACLSATLSSLVTNVTGSGMAVATNYYAPYWRLQLFTDGTDILDAGTATVRIAVLEH